MQIQNDFKSLPKIEVSFQDDYCGTEREITLTPKFILAELEKLGVEPVIGSKILLWEKDETDSAGDYLCNVGEIRVLKQSEIEEYSRNKKITPDELILLKGIPIIVKINKEIFFRLNTI